MRQQGTRDFLAPFQGALLRWSAFPGVRKKRVPLANFLAPLRGATKGCKGLIFLLFCYASLAQAQPQSTPTVVQIDLNDIVHPVSASYVRDGIKHAKDIGA